MRRYDVPGEGADLLVSLRVASVHELARGFGRQIFWVLRIVAGAYDSKRKLMLSQRLALNCRTIQLQNKSGPGTSYRFCRYSS